MNPLLTRIARFHVIPHDCSGRISGRRCRPWLKTLLAAFAAWAA